jgi:hypothetical protein
VSSCPCPPPAPSTLTALAWADHYGLITNQTVWLVPEPSRDAFLSAHEGFQGPNLTGPALPFMGLPPGYTYQKLMEASRGALGAEPSGGHDPGPRSFHSSFALELQRRNASIPGIDRKVRPFCFFFSFPATLCTI